MTTRMKQRDGETERRRDIKAVKRERERSGRTMTTNANRQERMLMPMATDAVTDEDAMVRKMERESVYTRERE